MSQTIVPAILCDYTNVRRRTHAAMPSTDKTHKTAAF